MYSNKTFSYNPVPLIIVSILGIHNELHVHLLSNQVFLILETLQLLASQTTCTCYYCPIKGTYSEHVLHICH